MVTFDSDSLSKLCSEDQRSLLNSIDQLRLEGVDSYVSLPQIIVCGDQSSGKSSVLEAISGVKFPVKSNLCTRHPTELVLRRAPDVIASVGIVPSDSRSPEERKALLGFRQTLASLDDLSTVMDEAKLAMGISPHGKAFSRDILRIELQGPDRPQLSLVDLPGLIHAETKHQSSSDIELIQEVVKKYMEEPRSVILAVVSAKNDFANQIVLKLARSFSHRSLGVITKPDELVAYSASEALFLSLAKNQQVEFRLGWHVLKNMDSEKGSRTLEDRDAKEAEFFSQGAWTSLPNASLGIETLRTRLSKVLLRQIAGELPGLIQEIDGKMAHCKDELTKLGEPRANQEEQRLYLFHLSQAFQAVVKSAVDGTYNDSFFKDAQTSEGYQQRIRAIVQNLNEDFAAELSTRGHYREISAETASEVVPSDASTPGASTSKRSKGVLEHSVIRITRDQFLDHIQSLLRKTRGRELPGTFNPMVVADLHIEQSRPWRAIVEKHVEQVWKAATLFLELVAGYIADETTSRALQRDIIEPAMKRILVELKEKTKELLRPHQSGHPITYNNHYFPENWQKARRERLEEAVTTTVGAFFNVNVTSSNYVSGHFNMEQLVRSLLSSSEGNIDKWAAQEALDCLNAYYKVALKRFIDDIAVEVIEEKLVSELSNILSPVSVFKMANDQVTRVAGESEDSRAKRHQLSRQIEVLRNGLDVCKNFVGLKIGGDVITTTTPGKDLGLMVEEEDEHFDVSPAISHTPTSTQSVAYAAPESEPEPVEPEPERVEEFVEEFVEEPEPEPEPEAESVAEPVVQPTDPFEFWGIGTPSKKKKKKKGKGKKEDTDLLAENRVVFNAS
ncbi:hypothetical protein OQA88_9096 [Cercophora sp. LCS_1]